jgi:CrcB protein
MWHRILLIALAGAAGTLSRYGLSALVYRLAGGTFPWATLAVNVVGCFCFGLVWALGEGRGWMTPETRLIVLVGFMGAFTTFSTFAFETDGLMRTGRWLEAGGNIILQNVVGIAAVALGLLVGRPS